MEPSIHAGLLCQHIMLRNLASSEEVLCQHIIMLRNPASMLVSEKVLCQHICYICEEVLSTHMLREPSIGSEEVVCQHIREPSIHAGQ